MKLAIAVPALTNVPAVFANDLALLYAETSRAIPQITLAMMIGTFVHQAREKLLRDVTELWGATHILWLDADMMFPQNAALRLLAHDKDVIAANYVSRTARPRPTAMRDGKCVSSVDATGLESVDHVGMGVFLMKTSFIADLPRPRFWYSTETETEDVYFCRLLRAAGHDIWIDHALSRSVGHIGQYTYREKAEMSDGSPGRSVGSYSLSGSCAPVTGQPSMLPPNAGEHS